MLITVSHILQCFILLFTGRLRDHVGLERAHHIPRDQGSNPAQAHPGRRGGDPEFQEQTVLQRRSRQIRLCL